MNLSSFGNDLNIAIIGASGGIGSAMVERFVQSDQVHKIYAYSRKAMIFESSKVINHFIDLRDEKTIAEAASKIEVDTLDIIIIATGLLHDNELQPEKSLNDLGMDKFMNVYAVNVFGPALVMKYFSKFLPRDRKSVLAALSARVASISDNRIGGWYAYRSSKTALNMIIKNTAIELGRRFKRACIIGLHPGTVDTQLSEPFQSHVKPGKLFTSQQSADYLIDVINQVSVDDTGRVFAWDGQVIEN